MEYTEEAMNEIVKGYNGKTYTIRELAEKAGEFTQKNSKEKKAKETFEPIYNSDEDLLTGEEWRTLTQKGWSKYAVSNKGRIRWNGHLIKQYDEIRYGKERTGYLVLDRNKEYDVEHHFYVYKMVAMAFLGKEENDKYHVHHIDNNGYDCRPENLILLTPEQHSYVHVFSCEIYNDKEKSDCV